MKRILSKAAGLAIAAVASAYIFLLAVGVTAAAAGPGAHLARMRTLAGARLFSPLVSVVIALVGTAAILGIAILFTPREPPAWQQEMRRSQFDDTDDERGEERERRTTRRTGAGLPEAPGRQPIGHDVPAARRPWHCGGERPAMGAQPRTRVPAHGAACPA